MNAHLTLGILNGDDIGHEVVPAAVEVAKAAAARHGLKIDWRPMPIGRRALDTHGSTMPDGTLEALVDDGRLDPRPDRPPRLPEGSGRHQPAPDPAQALQPVRQRAADALVSGHRLRLRRHRPHHRAREQRGFSARPQRGRRLRRVPAQRRPDHLGARHLARRQPARGARRAGAGAASPETLHLRAQEHGVQARLRHVRGGVLQGGRGVSGRRRSTRSSSTPWPCASCATRRAST